MPIHSTRARAAALGVPAALVGSLALSLISAPAAHAAEPAHSAAQRPTATTATTYTVQRGDTVFAIARSHGLRTADVLAWNSLTAASLIRPGQVLSLVAPAATPAVAAPAAPAAPVTASHVVRAGDTVFAIARAHGVSTAALLAANGLAVSSIIYPGQTLVVPGAAPAASATPVAAPVAAAPAAAAASHVVRAGDTVSAIARAHGVSTAAVLAANGLDTGSIIYPGQTLSIPATSAAASATDMVPASSATIALDAEQSANARLIISVGRQLGVSDRGITIALGTAMQESWLRNLDWGDRDSLGLYQQRPSTGWGTADQVRDAERSTRAFFGGPSDPNGSRTRGLLDIAGWEGMSFADAAQAVQISAYPDRYAQWEQPAGAWLAALG